MTMYNVWWQGVGEICMGKFEGKSHKEIRKLVHSMIIIRKEKVHNSQQTSTKGDKK